jgi:hypothetical protein
MMGTMDQNMSKADLSDGTIYRRCCIAANVAKKMVKQFEEHGLLYEGTNF